MNDHMMNTMMGGSTGMMLAMGASCLLFVIVLILAAAALVKYLFGTGRNNRNGKNSNA